MKTGETTTSHPTWEGTKSMTGSGADNNRSPPITLGASGAVEWRSSQGHLPGGKGAGTENGVFDVVGSVQCPQHDRGVDAALPSFCGITQAPAMQHQPSGNASGRLQARIRDRKKTERIFAPRTR